MFPEALVHFDRNACVEVSFPDFGEICWRCVFQGMYYISFIGFLMIVLNIQS